MKITKYAHACLLVEEGSAKMLIDPGSWNKPPDAQGVSAILITHEHQDHMDVGQIRGVLADNPDAIVISHQDVANLLAASSIPATVIEEGGTVEVDGISVRSYGHEHAAIYGDASPCRNTGFLIAGKLFVPGDALHDVPDSPVELLALPTGGPWMRISEAIDYAKRVRPQVAFPIHDAMYIESYQRELVPRIVGSNLEASGIAFRDMAAGAVEEF